MTWVPTGALESGILSEPSPIVGSVEDITQVGEYVQKAVDDSFVYRSGIQGAERSLASGQGDALYSLQDKLSKRLIPGVDVLDASASEAKKGLDSFGHEVGRIHGDARKLITDVEARLSTIRVQAGIISEIARAIGASEPTSWRTAPPGEIPEPTVGSKRSDLDADQQALSRQLLKSQYSMQWLSAAAQWKLACEDIESCQTKWTNLVRDRKDAESRVVGALRATDLGMLIEAGQTGRYSPKEIVAFGLSGEIRGIAFADEGAKNAEVDKLLANDDLSGADLTSAWNALGLSKEDIAGLPMATLAELAHRNGLPAWVQDIASTELLHYSLVAPNEAYNLFGFGCSGPGVDGFRTQTLQLHQAWRTAKQEASRMGGSPTVQLLALGSHDGAMTAAISHGNIDTASHVAANISGMLSNVGDIGGDARGARSLYNEAYRENPTQTYAAVTWIGYRSPGFLDVNLMDRANAGAPELAGFIDGIFDSRNANAAPISNFTVFAHSYGSTTAAVALEQTQHQVNSFVTYGSAGFKQSSIENIHADGVFSTHADGDQTAGLGKLWQHKQDPRDLAGVSEFSAEGDDDYLRVTAHDMFTEDDSASPMNWGGKVGYLTTGTRSAEEMGKIWANGGQ